MSLFWQTLALLSSFIICINYLFMRSFIHKHLQGILSLLFAIVVALFWAFPYRCALSYQEQYQLFLFTPSYFTERICVPGGLADYVAEFITQFYYVYALGTILLALVYSFVCNDSRGC